MDISSSQEKQENKIGEENGTPDENNLQMKERDKNPILEIIKFALLALVIVVPIRAYIASPFLVNGGSMSPTFETGDYLIVDRLSYNFENPSRGDIIIFRYPKDPSQFFIKRVIGLPGETLQIQNGIVTIDGEKAAGAISLTEPYVEFQKYDNLKTSLGDDEYFVLGDNRSASSDSRLWGTLPENLIEGRVLLRLFPINVIDFLPGAYEF